MAITIPFKLNKPAQQFQAGGSTGFSIRTGVKYRDPKTKEEKWTNYQAVIFAKSPAQIQFYNDALVEGAMVVVSGEKLAVETFDGSNGQVITLSILNANVEAVNFGGQQRAAAQQHQAAPQPAPQAAAQPQGGFDDFDDDIPF